MALINFNAARFDTTQAGQAPAALPTILEGFYDGVITSSKMVQSKTSVFEFLQLKIEITTPGPFVNREVLHNLNINNPKSADIAGMQLAQIMKYSGAGEVLEHDRDLLNRRVRFKTKVTPAKPNPAHPGAMFKERAEILYFTPLDIKGDGGSQAVAGAPAAILDDVPF